MRLPNSAHTSRPWRIHELTHDFRLEDVWAPPGIFGPHDFPRLVQQFALLDPSQSSSIAVRTLFVIRLKLGELLGWDDAGAGLGSRVPTLRYVTEDEWAAEIANRTVHGIIHIGRVANRRAASAPRWRST